MEIVKVKKTRKHQIGMENCCDVCYKNRNNTENIFDPYRFLIEIVFKTPSGFHRRHLCVAHYNDTKIMRILIDEMKGREQDEIQDQNEYIEDEFSKFCLISAWKK